MSKPTPILWSDIKHAFIKMGGGDGGITIPGGEMGCREGAAIINNTIFTYDNAGLALYNGVGQAIFEDVVPGLYSITVRIKWCGNPSPGEPPLTGNSPSVVYNSNPNFIIFCVYRDDNANGIIKIAESRVKFSDFIYVGGNANSSNNFASLGMVFDTRNVDDAESSRIIRFETRIEQSIAAYVYIDYCTLAMVNPGVYSLPVQQY